MAISPMRTCTGCRSKQARGRLLRVTHAGDGTLSVDSTRTGAGRGAYVCFDRACIERACRSGSLARALRFGGAIPEGLRAELMATMRGIDG
jgi:predicted RNA-binding protein YlxR (DUF448 family)